MKTNSILMGIAILMATPLLVCAADAHTEPKEAEIRFADTLNLQELTIQANFSNSGRSALRLKTITNQAIRERATARTYPELLKGIPSLYATSESGSYGDAKLNIRGFGQENISVLLNGIPISGLVSGGMYWNNWMGLADATYAIQVQKGVGASLLSDGSVGGSVNIITDPSTQHSSGEVGYYGADFGTMKGYLKFSSGELRRGWAFNFMLSYVGGKGYVNATTVSSLAYMLNVSKRIGDRHTLIFTTMGSPEEHEQRSQRLSAAEVEKYGIKYSKNWGYRDGKTFNLSLNNYFKPYFTLQHLYKGERLDMKNSLYLAIGAGGGRWTETKGKSIASYMKDGQIDWQAAIVANRNPDGSANNIVSKYMAGHTHIGAVSTMDYSFDDKWRIGGGFHGQIYNTWEHERIVDLLGADHWVEDYEHKSLAGLAGRNPIKVEGDLVRTENGKHVLHSTLYISAEYNSNRVNLNFGASLFGSTIQRWDRYNYVGSDVNSPTAAGVGTSIKGGALFHISNSYKFYMNAGFYSRLPYSNVWFASGNNQKTKEVKNEKNLLGEVGWRMVWQGGSSELTGYAALWKNKSLMSNKYKQMSQEDTRYMITGLDAFHYGLEFSISQRLANVVEANAFASLGKWRWINNVEAIIYDDYSGAQIDKVNLWCKDMPVADSPQTQLGADVKVTIFKCLSFNAMWQFNSRIYADFDPLTRSNPNDSAEPYRYPSYSLFGATLNWSSGDKTKLNLFATCDNLFDAKFIERGKDGSDHTLETFRGYWGLGRRFSFGMRIGF